MSGQTMARLWASYETAAVPRSAGVEQRRGTKMAFYGGAKAMLEAIKTTASDDVTEDDGAAFLEALSSELDRYVLAVASGQI